MVGLQGRRPAVRAPAHHRRPPRVPAHRVETRVGDRLGSGHQHEPRAAAGPAGDLAAEQPDGVEPGDRTGQGDVSADEPGVGGGRGTRGPPAQDTPVPVPPGAHLLAMEVGPARVVQDGPGVNPEFTLVHALMGQTLLTDTRWSAALDRAGFDTLTARGSG
ncbi:hypothetical protein IAG44_04940 [Streptomyces roseirectus]|uniref:Uncharacterized protein n=1 Tax=Streptomyces roseirectus TaxID=2768066 RepID=A0A7H0ITV5_9ACTN|nr:hypothetical protein [Streptomyces roseirectus]QNP76221.1 hypothetical protein IAG44_04940 [Streptomyces roseirectus]